MERALDRLGGRIHVAGPLTVVADAMQDPRDFVEDVGMVVDCQDIDLRVIHVPRPVEMFRG